MNPLSDLQAAEPGSLCIVMFIYFMTRHCFLLPICLENATVIAGGLW